MPSSDEFSETIEAICPQCRVSSRYAATNRGTVVECAVCSAEVGIGLPVATMIQPPQFNFGSAANEGKPRVALRAVPARSPVRGVLLGLAGVTVLGGGAAGLYFALQTGGDNTNPSEIAANGPSTPKRGNVRAEEPSAAAKLPADGEEPKKSLMADRPVIKPFKDAEKAPAKPPEKSPVAPPGPPIRKRSEAPIAVKKPETKELPVTVPAPLPAIPVPTPAPTPAVPVPTAVQEPTVIPKAGFVVPASTQRSAGDLLDYESSSGTLKAKAMIERGDIVLILVPTAVKVEGQSQDNLFTFVRPTEGRYKGRFLVVRASRVTLPKP